MVTLLIHSAKKLWLRQRDGANKLVFPGGRRRVKSCLQVTLGITADKQVIAIAAECESGTGAAFCGGRLFKGCDAEREAAAADIEPKIAINIVAQRHPIVVRNFQGRDGIKHQRLI